jgi:SAM-dependent methyltransferase
MGDAALIDAEWNQAAWGNYEANLRFLRLAGLPQAPQRILEIGCGKGAILAHLQALGHRCTGIDIDPRALAQCHAEHPELTIGLASGDALPFEDGSFDLVVSLDVFEHIKDSDRHIAEVRRVLKGGGRYLLQTPNKLTNIPFEILRHSRKLRIGPVAAYREVISDHCALHSLWQLRRRFRQHGFELSIFDIPVVDDYFRAKMRRYLGVCGGVLLAIINPDDLPAWLRTNFYACARRVDR